MKTADLKCLLYNETKSVTASPQTTSTALYDVTLVTRGVCETEHKHYKI